MSAFLFSKDHATIIDIKVTLNNFHVIGVSDRRVKRVMDEWVSKGLATEHQANDRAPVKWNLTLPGRKEANKIYNQGKLIFPRHDHLIEGLDPMPEKPTIAAPKTKYA